MALWVSFAIMTAVAALAILRPFWRRAKSSAEAPRDIEVYRQQLQEVDEEAARGVLGETEAKAARIEVSRRILAAAEQSKPFQTTVPRRAFAPYVLAGLLPAIALSLYGLYGSPDYAAQPLAARAPSDGQAVEGLVARVEERLQLHPEDGTGWSVIAPVYMRMERFADAAEAYRNALRLLGETAERAADLGEALTLANDGAVDIQAREALDRAVSLDPAQPKARFWLAVATEQAGKTAEAIAAYRALLARNLPDPVKAVVNQRIALLEGGAAGPATPDPAANSGVDAAQINRMVSGLAERLKQDGSDLKGWLMLVRAYTVLGRQVDALSALKDARGRFAGNNDALGQIDALAKSLGLPS